MKYILKLSSPEWKKFQNVKFHFPFPRFDKTVNYTFQNEKIFPPEIEIFRRKISSPQKND